MRAREGASRALRGVCVFLYVFYLFINDLYRFLLYKKSQATTSHQQSVKIVSGFPRFSAVSGFRET